MAMAINRASLVKHLIRGDARVIHTPCFPTQFGCDASAAKKWPFDPAQAKKLLAEAGYPNGFEIDFYTFRPADWAEAIMGDLSKVGIKANSDPAIRKANYAKAIKKITEQVYWLPMFNHVRNYAFNEKLNFIPYQDEIPRFWQYGWK